MIYDFLGEWVNVDGTTKPQIAKGTKPEDGAFCKPIPVFSPMPPNPLKSVSFPCDEVSAYGPCKYNNLCQFRDLVAPSLLFGDLYGQQWEVGEYWASLWLWLVTVSMAKTPCVHLLPRWGSLPVALDVTSGFFSWYLWHSPFNSIRSSVCSSLLGMHGLRLKKISNMTLAMSYCFNSGHRFKVTLLWHTLLCSKLFPLLHFALFTTEKMNVELTSFKTRVTSIGSVSESLERFLWIKR